MLIILLKLQNEFKNLNFHVVFFNQFNFAFFYQIHVEFYSLLLFHFIPFLLSSLFNKTHPLFCFFFFPCVIPLKHDTHQTLILLYFSTFYILSKYPLLTTKKITQVDTLEVSTLIDFCIHFNILS